MNKEQAQKTLMGLINNLKLTKAEYDVLSKAVMILSMPGMPASLPPQQEKKADGQQG